MGGRDERRSVKLAKPSRRFHSASRLLVSASTAIGREYFATVIALTLGLGTAGRLIMNRFARPADLTALLHNNENLGVGKIYVG